MNFCKMHGLGNDFIVIENLQGNLSLDKFQIVSICDRRYGIGADGVMIVNSSETCDIKMSFFNSDGSEVEMCGNGIRCFAKYVYDKDIVKKNPIDIETLAGIKTTFLEIQNSKVIKVQVDMGTPIFESQKIPIDNSKERAIDEKVEFNDHLIDFSAISMGNPHVVIFVDDLDNYPIKKIGPFIENHSLFPKKTNVNFVQIIDNENIRVVTWERGAGLTLACGTGTCASVAIANYKGFVKKKVNASLPGGNLLIEIKDTIYMTGEAVTVFEGIIE
ncbi:diaminopimelate epimerase [Alkalibaculum sp. M08DMB]|uniref:Diaminopimelate epimerase n=1 Tax=Alkalibaculum sporogenes TaxID=2655001 RepID=A0A6A7K9J3_9FIRM|nr:diaminopimelate epimerase [Alkalibaculum sporogenes]MPW26025.1 diaminopimelate epimerase [Alkalibaculum sporogenes]